MSSMAGILTRRDGSAFEFSEGKGHERETKGMPEYIYAYTTLTTLCYERLLNWRSRRRIGKGK